MPDHAAPQLPQIAFVFGDDARAAHVRDAVGGHVEIVYDTPHAAFDPARLRDAPVASVLVNMDAGDWLGALEDAVRASGARLVLNDPDISRSLEGWERARWLRHLLAKIRGSKDVDPPRPAAAPASADQHPAPQPAPDALPETVQAADTVIERPLSPHEIETLTADFSALPTDGDGAVPDPDEASGDTLAAADTQPGMTMLESATDIEQAAADGEGAGGTDAAATLDVDTEALSAMIDARLAEPAREKANGGEVWRVADDAAAADASADALAPVAAATRGEGPDEGVRATVADGPAGVAVVDDADVLAGLPSLDDWQLVDAAAVAEPAGRKQAAVDVEATFVGSLADLELVPMEAIVPVQSHAEPIERWLQEEPRTKKTADGSTSGGERG